jgi:hypothetical protein
MASVGDAVRPLAQQAGGSRVAQQRMAPLWQPRDARGDVNQSGGDLDECSRTSFLFRLRAASQRGAAATRRLYYAMKGVFRGCACRCADSKRVWQCA